jgi:hypothetical protein
MSNTSSDQGDNVSFMTKNATRLNPSSPTDLRIINPKWSATINGPADNRADAIAKLFPEADDRISDSIVYDPIEKTVSLEGSAQMRELKDYCGDGVEPFGTEYDNQIVPGVLGPVFTLPVVTPPISPPIPPITETVEKEVITTTTTTTTVLPGSPPPSPPKTPIPLPTPPEYPPTSPPVTPPAGAPPTSLPDSPPISSWALSTSSTSGHRVSPPLPSPILSPPLTSTYSPVTRSVGSGGITPPISSVVVLPPTPPSVKVARTSYFPPFSP